MRKCKYLYTSERFLIHVALLENSWEYLVKFIIQQSHFWAYILEKFWVQKKEYDGNLSVHCQWEQQVK